MCVCVGGGGGSGGGGGGALKLFHGIPTFALSFYGGKITICSVHVEVFKLIHESLRDPNKSQIKPLMKQR